MVKLLLGKKESLLSPADVVQEYHYLSEMQGRSLPVGVSSAHE